MMGGRTPTLVQSRGVYTDIGVGNGHGHVRALTADGDAYCWGLNSNGVLGNGKSYGSGSAWEDFSPIAVRVAPSRD